MKIPADIGRHWGSQLIPGQIYRDKQPLTFTSTGNLESPVNLRVFRLWEKARVPGGENPRRHANRTQKDPIPARYRTQDLLAVK